MPRDHFINPYTFVPLRVTGAVCKTDEIPTHAWLDQNRFSGTIKCDLKFITPAVIPGEQQKRDENLDEPGEIPAYRYGDYLAIPGARLRGHVLNIMRSLNASPIRNYMDKMILGRVAGRVKAGFLFFNNKGELAIKDIGEEILVAHIKRRNRNSLFNKKQIELANQGKSSNEQVYDIQILMKEGHNILTEYGHSLATINSNSYYWDQSNGFYKFKLSMIEDEKLRAALKTAGESLQNVTPVTSGVTLLEPSDDAIYYTKDDKEHEVPFFDPGLLPGEQGGEGKIYYENPLSGPARKYRRYMVRKAKQQVKSKYGCWVKFDCWSGQDGENQFKDTHGNKQNRNHWNKYHVVNLTPEIHGATYPIPDLEKYDAAVENMAIQAENRQDEDEQKLADHIRGMKGLKAGDFIYFQEGKGQIKTFGRHYRYLYRLGTVDEKVAVANKGHKWKNCIVNKLSGWADEDIKPSSMKSRVWVEMAIGPNSIEMETSKRLKMKNLRILSSQPPKASQFYLDGGGYDNSGSEIRGRKMYWHDHLWEDPMWDNEDSGEGENAFENPHPDNNKKQWSEAEVLYPVKDGEPEFKFSIRVVNLTDDELNLLLTVLTGFSPTVIANCIKQQNENDWCHKIGHCRPFMGSAIIRVKKVEKLDIDGKTWEPKTLPLELSEVITGLNVFQKDTFDETSMAHIRTLKRVMDFKGAHKVKVIGNYELQDQDARIAYPIGQETNSSVSWQGNPEDHPKTFKWFGGNKTTPLPKAENLTESQVLKVWKGRRNNG